MSSVEVREIDADELGEWARLAGRGFHGQRRVTEDSLAARRRAVAGQRVRAAVDRGRFVGTFRSWDVALPVPGGTVDADAVSSVTVAATHRRQGVLSTMMRADLAQAAERGAALAVLVASEAPIYGRFGFAPATQTCRWEVDRRAATFAADPAADGEVTLELCEDADLLDVAPALYASAAAGMPGAMPREDLWWRQTLGLVDVPEADRDQARPAVVVRDRTGEPVGTASYRVEASWEAWRPRGTVEVLDLTATTLAGYTALWRFLTDLDLTVTVSAGKRPVHEPLPWLLADRRAARRREHSDFQWVRLLDVPSALRGRRYAVPGTSVLQVEDAAGLAGCRVRLTAAEDGSAQVEATSAEPDVVLAVEALASAYLGQVPLGELRLAGQVDERTPGAVRRLGALLAWTPTAAVGHTSF